MPRLLLAGGDNKTTFGWFFFIHYRLLWVVSGHLKTNGFVDANHAPLLNMVGRARFELATNGLAR